MMSVGRILAILRTLSAYRDHDTPTSLVKRPAPVRARPSPTARAGQRELLNAGRVSAVQPGHCDVGVTTSIRAPADPPPAPRRDPREPPPRHRPRTKTAGVTVALYASSLAPISLPFDPRSARTLSPRMATRPSRFESDQPPARTQSHLSKAHPDTQVNQSPGQETSAQETHPSPPTPFRVPVPSSLSHVGTANSSPRQ